MLGALLAGGFAPVPAVFSRTSRSTGHLCVENRTGSEVVIRLSVDEEGDDGSRLVHAEYRIPAEVVLQFEGVLEPGSSYDVRAFQPSVVGRERLAFGASTCDEDDPAEQRDVAVWATANGPDSIVHSCDDAYSKDDELTYADPSEYLVAELAEPIATPEPGGGSSVGRHSP